MVILALKTSATSIMGEEESINENAQVTNVFDSDFETVTESLELLN